MHHSKTPMPDDQRTLQEQQQQLRELLEKEAERLELGATDLFPQGKLEPNDEGEIRFAVTNTKGKVIINFGKPVAYLGMNSKQAKALAELLEEHAEKANKGRVPPPPGSYR